MPAGFLNGPSSHLPLIDRLFDQPRGQGITDQVDRDTWYPFTQRLIEVVISTTTAGSNDGHRVKQRLFAFRDEMPDPNTIIDEPEDLVLGENCHSAIKQTLVQMATCHWVELGSEKTLRCHDRDLVASLDQPVSGSHPHVVTLRVEYDSGVADRVAVERSSRGHETVFALFKVWNVRGGPGCDDNDVGRERSDHVGVGFDAVLDINLEPVECALQVVSHGTELAPAGRPSRELDLSAEFIVFFEKYNAMASQCGDAGCLHAGNPAADDDDVQSLGRWAQFR